MKNIPKLILQNGNIFNSKTGKLQQKTVVIKDNKIEWIGSHDSYDTGSKDKVIDVKGKFILPGLIDCHVHLDYSGEVLIERKIVQTKTDMYHYIALNNAQKHLLNGFTCVRDCGSEPGWAPALRRCIEMGLVVGPRLVVSDRPIAQFGNQELVYPDFLIEYNLKQYETISGVDGMIHAVRQRKMHGSDFIKTATTGGVLHGQESRVGTSLWRDDELLAMTDEAHRIGMHVASHAHGKEGIYRAVKNNIDTIEHGSFIDEESAKLMVKQGTYLIPTHSALHYLKDPAVAKDMTPVVKEKIKETGKNLIANHRMAYEKGVKIAIGTDAGTPGNYHGTTSYELQLMVEHLGMTPVEAIKAATIEAATAIRLEDKIGSIEIGKYADLLICKKNPLKDITSLTNYLNLIYVIKDGVIVVEKGKMIFNP